MFTIRHRREADEPLTGERVAALLDAACAPADPGPAPGEAEALAAFRAAQDTSRSQGSRAVPSPRSLRIAAAAVLGTGVLLTGGVAAAQAGSLPAPAQDAARAILAKVGVSVPGSDDHATGHSDGRGGPTDTPRKRGGGSAGAPAEKSAEHTGKGADVSDLARRTDSTGADKGAEISRRASDGKSHAGEHGKAEAPGSHSARNSAGNARVTTPNTGGVDRPDRPGAGANAVGPGSLVGHGHAPVTLPNKHGNGTAPGANGDPSAFGQSTADAASGGHSSAGSGNASAHRPNSRPSSRPGNRPHSPPGIRLGNRP